MSEEKEDLFEGLQIMSPEELNAVVESDENSEEEGEEKNKVKDTPEGVFTPVSSEEGEGSYENTKNQSKEEGKTATSNERSEEIYKGLIKELVESNIITAAEADKLDELEGSLDTIKELMNKTVQTNFKAAEEQWKENMPAAKKRFLEIEDAL